jgi:hypothetical protein
MRPIDNVIKMLAGAAIVALGLYLFFVMTSSLEKQASGPEDKRGFLSRKFNDMRKAFRLKTPYTSDEIREKAKAYIQ